MAQAALRPASEVTYPSPPPKSPPPAVVLAFVQAAADLQSITVADAEGTPANDQHVWYTIQITDANKKVWTLDPEVVNTGGNNTRLGFFVPTSADLTQTLGTAGVSAAAVITRNPYAPAPSSKR